MNNDIYISNKIWGKHTHARAHNNIFVIENYMHIIIAQTHERFGMGEEAQHSLQAANAYITRSRFLVTTKKDNT